MRHRAAFSETTLATHDPIHMTMECNAEASHVLAEGSAMTRWPHREFVADQPQGVELPTIHTVVPGCVFVFNRGGGETTTVVPPYRNPRGLIAAVRRTER
jgi:hypothetical protein